MVTLLNAAVREDLISLSPLKKINKIDLPKPKDSQRCFLTIEEVKRLEATPSRRDDIKRAFLFSCFCGMRYSDVSRLTWDNIEENAGEYYANIVMKKTSEALYLPLNKKAISYLPERSKEASGSELIFPKIPKPVSLGRRLGQWAADAGIKKHITFHVARHTFATTSLTLGADLYTVSKLLGHGDVRTTQIYAKIVNEKKVEAVSLFDKVF